MSRVSGHVAFSVSAVSVLPRCWCAAWRSPRRSRTTIAPLADRHDGIPRNPLPKAARTSQSTWIGSPVKSRTSIGRRPRRQSSNGALENTTAFPSRHTPTLSISSNQSEPRTPRFGEGAEGGALLNANGERLLHIVFVSPQIHWNTGNIGRTCLGLGAQLHLVGPLGFSLDERQIRRAGLDYWHHVNVQVYEDWESFSKPNGPMYSIGGSRYFFTKFGAVSATTIDWAQEAGLSCNEGTSTTMATDMKPIVLLFGSEVDGFDNIRDWLDGPFGENEKRVAFPMVDDRFRSFNLSTTASMAMWDVYKSITIARQRMGAVAETADAASMTEV